MIGGFQPQAFQPLPAFQQEAQTRSQGAGNPNRRKRREPDKYLVEIDGERFYVGSVAEATDILTEAANLAQQQAEKSLQKATESRLKPNKLRRVLKHQLKTPDIRVQGSETDQTAVAIERVALQIRDQIAALYESVVRDAEIGLYLRRQQEQEEEEFIIGLLL